MTSFLNDGHVGLKAHWSSDIGASSLCSAESFCCRGQEEKPHRLVFRTQIKSGWIWPFLGNPSYGSCWNSPLPLCVSIEMFWYCVSSSATISVPWRSVALMSDEQGLANGIQRVAWRWEEEGSPQSCASVKEIPRESWGEEKGKIGAVLQPWLLKRHYSIACRSRKSPQPEDRRVRGRGQGPSCPARLEFEAPDIADGHAAGCLPSPKLWARVGSSFMLPYVAALNWM